MNWWLFLIPFIGAVAGWLMVSMLLKLLFHPVATRNIAGLRFRGLIPARQPAIAAAAGRLSASLLSMKEMEETITSPENVRKIMPEAEEHIDHFLRVKLVKSMPVVGMFVGDKTINNLKSLFVAELEQLFPEIMKNYMERLQGDVDIEAMVTRKLAAIPIASIEHAFHDMMRKELRLIKALGALLGLVIGVIQLLFWLLFH